PTLPCFARCARTHKEHNIPLRANPILARPSSRLPPDLTLRQRPKREVRMSKTRIGTLVRCGPVNVIYKLNRSKQGSFLLLRAGVALRSAMLVLLAALLAAIP